MSLVLKTTCTKSDLCTLSYDQMHTAAGQTDHMTGLFLLYSAETGARLRSGKFALVQYVHKGLAVLCRKAYDHSSHVTPVVRKLSPDQQQLLSASKNAFKVQDRCTLHLAAM